ncbi:MAG: 1-deoxy-D-xylulose-5-phosphate reductoisomerase [Ignavibacteriales bacterium]|nr:MAG: 1-deoxy-D-xylulose-5-phosphate reductoisomerase [Ignavibacteriales bacterium]
MKKVFILGSTGSIGVNTLEVIKCFPDKFIVTGLTANSNIGLLEKQILEFRPSTVVVSDKIAAVALNKRLNGKFEVLAGEQNLAAAAKNEDYDVLVSSLVGFVGLAPTIEGIKRGKRIALANKETLVVAGELITKLLKENNSQLLPIDSEHSAIFQCLIGEKIEEVEKLIITASGGPFLNHNKEMLKKVSIKEALTHPNWKMGNKITIDSASMMNKGLEVIEAHWLFGFSQKKIEVVIHPQSVIHSMIEFIDGSIKAQLSLPDMKLPIQFALSYPERFKSRYVETKFPDIKNLSFYEPDYERFECLKLAYQVLEQEGTTSCILNASNEIAVSKFLNGCINFTQIPEMIKESLDKIENHKSPDIDTIIECDRQTREFAEKLFT